MRLAAVLYYLWALLGMLWIALKLTDSLPENGVLAWLPAAAIAVIVFVLLVLYATLDIEKRWSAKYLSGMAFLGLASFSFANSAALQAKLYTMTGNFEIIATIVSGAVIAFLVYARRDEFFRLRQSSNSPTPRGPWNMPDE